MNDRVKTGENEEERSDEDENRKLINVSVTDTHPCLYYYLCEDSHWHPQASQKHLVTLS